MESPTTESEGAVIEGQLGLNVTPTKHRAAALAVFEGMPLRSAEDERQMAINWCETAAQHLTNEEYWRERAKKAEADLEEWKTPDSRD